LGRGIMQWRHFCSTNLHFRKLQENRLNYWSFNYWVFYVNFTCNGSNVSAQRFLFNCCTLNPFLKVLGSSVGGFQVKIWALSWQQIMSHHWSG
jgi:hypothetical protein